MATESEGFARLHVALAIHHQSPAAKQSSEYSFHHPAFRPHGEAMRTSSALDNFKIPVTHSLAPIGYTVCQGGKLPGK
jgi:hypothetical protein